MHPITSAVIVLDQASGTVREHDGRAVGLDLTTTARDAVAAGRAIGVDVILAVPGRHGADLIDELPRSLIGARVVPVGALRLGGEWHSPAPAPAEHVATTALVSADRSLRAEARAAGLVPAAHPALLPMLARGADPRPARVAGPRGTLERLAAGGDVVPMQFQPAPEGADWAIFGLFSEERLVEAATLGLAVHPLSYDPATQDLVWIRPDGSDEGARAALSGFDTTRVLYVEPGQLLVALDAGEDVDSLGVHGRHGHTEFLPPDPGLLTPPADVEPVVDFDLDRIPSAIFEPVPVDPVRQRLTQWMRPKCSTVTAHYSSDLDRYTGVASLDAAGPIASRHVAHPDNARAEAALLADLRAMGYCPFRHDYVHGGATRSNIIADLPGTGHLRIRPEVERRIRGLLCEPMGRADLRSGDAASLLRDGLPGDDPVRLSDEQLRSELERILGLRPWYPWWELRCPNPGWGARLVIVGAHLDSTAGFQPGFDPTTDPAPGRDDNGSGLAAVLSLARYFAGFAGLLTHTVRFCFFNSEESGLVGSKAYAGLLKSMGAPVEAVICTDMMGYNSDANRIFEIHAGYTDPAVRDLGLPTAQVVADAAASYGALAPAQVYRGTGHGGSPDRDVSDGAINRSDHAAFQQQGWGAVLVSEDFFANLPTEPGADPNPNYHRGTDQVTDTSYSRDIVCAIARAVIRLAA
ncbi:M28 family metallopeptidase [Agromyces binzhouensis]|uniref:M28 family metallopeptidase n=1 Tax=Agromyces binzhouensis TaxID=1817495 RepID=UPI003642413D